MACSTTITSLKKLLQRNVKLIFALVSFRCILSNKLPDPISNLEGGFQLKQSQELKPEWLGDWGIRHFQDQAVADGWRSYFTYIIWESAVLSASLNVALNILVLQLTAAGGILASLQSRTHLCSGCLVLIRTLREGKELSGYLPFYWQSLGSAHCHCTFKLQTFEQESKMRQEWVQIHHWNNISVTVIHKRQKKIWQVKSWKKVSWMFNASSKDAACWHGVKKWM